jgi:hypothetical protein
MRLPTQGPHRGDDTRASWVVSMKAGLASLIISGMCESRHGRVNGWPN